MAFDNDLNPLLEKCSDDDLAPLFYYIMENGDIAERLTDSFLYKEYFPKHSHYASVIADEIRLFGGDTFVNFFRRKGPAYKDIVMDVADKFKIRYNKNGSIDDIEFELLEGFVNYIWDRLAEEEKNVFVSNLNLRKEIAFEKVKNNLSDFLEDKDVLSKIFFIFSGIFGLEFNSKLENNKNKLMDFFNGIGIGNAIVSLSNPVGKIFNSLISTLYFSGPNFKVTVPSVLHIAALRRKYY